MAARKDKSDSKSDRLVDKIGAFVGVPIKFIENSATMTDEAFRLFVILRYRTNSQNDTAFPSYDEIQRLTGLHRSKVSAGLRELEEAGWLHRRKRFGQSTVYTLVMPPDNLDAGASSSDVGTTDSSDIGTTETRASSSTGCTPVVQTGEHYLDSSIKIHDDDDAPAAKPKKSRAKKMPPVETPAVVEYTLDEYKLTLQRLGVSGVNVSILAEDLFRARLPITTPGDLLAAADADAQAHGSRIHLPGAYLSAKVIGERLGWNYATYPAQSWAKHAKPLKPANGSSGYGARRPEPTAAPVLPFPTDTTVPGYVSPEQRRALRLAARKEAEERLNGRTA